MGGIPVPRGLAKFTTSQLQSQIPCILIGCRSRCQVEERVYRRHPIKYWFLVAPGQRSEIAREPTSSLFGCVACDYAAPLELTHADADLSLAVFDCAGTDL